MQYTYTYQEQTYFSEDALRRALPHIVFSTLTPELATRLGVVIAEYAPPPRDPAIVEAEQLQKELQDLEAQVSALRDQYTQATMLGLPEDAQQASQQLKTLLEESGIPELADPIDLYAEGNTQCSICFSKEDERGVCTRISCPSRRIKLRLWQLKNKV